jgi:uncharacterized repeat protein (TIGR03803 family)
MTIIKRARGGAVCGNIGPNFHRWLTLATGCWLLAAPARAQTFTVLHTFSGVNANGDGGNPSSLMVSTNGEFFGTCVNAGSDGWGEVYQITPAGTLTPVYGLTDGVYDGSTPYAGLTQGTNGLLYGMAQAGGSNGFGTIFDVKTNGPETGLFSFASEKGAHSTNANGANPTYALTLNTNNGNFYGTAEDGGTNGFGTVFQVTHKGQVTVFYSFSNSLDGAIPQASLLLYTNGNLYGTALGGGTNGNGTVFQLTAAGKLTPIYSFTNGIDGAAPQGALIDGKDGHLYGTCSAGGTNGTGTIFKITTNGVFTPLYSFSSGTVFPGGFPDTPEYEYNPDGINPKGLILGGDGNFYGVAYYGGANGAGSVYQFTRAGALNPLYSFTSALEGPNSDGANPVSLVQYTNGNLYGTAYNSGTNDYGTFFTIGFPPSISVQPSNQSIALHGNAAFTLTASNAQSFQWQFDGTNLPNATNDTLTIANAQITNAGSYQAIVTNLNGPTLSEVVTLSITNVPVSFLSGPSAFQYSGGQFSVELTNLTGQGDIVIEASTNLTQWSPIYTNPSAFGAAQFIDSAASNFPARFYRAVAP